MMRRFLNLMMFIRIEIWWLLRRIIRKFIEERPSLIIIVKNMIKL